jgi:phosphopentomutase
MIKRIIWIIIDSVGIGALPDADRFGDVGSNTLVHTVEATNIKLPNLCKLGLGNIEGMTVLNKEDNPTGVVGRIAEMSDGKDTTIGHWEMIGVYSETPFPTYPNGFPDEILDEFSKRTGRGVLGNIPASGTEIIKQLGEEHINTGKFIVYTSADSVFQIAAHEEVVPINELYKACEIARDILKGQHAVARVIARPFIGEKDNYTRTANRRDFSLSPPIDTILDHMKNNKYDVIGVGKIEDIFNKKGITDAIHTKDNMDGVDQTINYMKEDNKGLIFTNLVEFDSKWGHRNDVEGYGNGLKDFDNRLVEIIDNMEETDVLFINADHGCDPTFPGTDHTREYIPFIAYGKSLKEGVNLGTRKTFADIGQTIADIFELPSLPVGESFLDMIKK